MNHRFSKSSLYQCDSGAFRCQFGVYFPTSDQQTISSISSMQWAPYVNWQWHVCDFFSLDFEIFTVNRSPFGCGVRENVQFWRRQKLCNEHGVRIRSRLVHVHSLVFALFVPIAIQSEINFRLDFAQRQNCRRNIWCVERNINTTIFNLINIDLVIIIMIIIIIILKLFCSTTFREFMTFYWASNGRTERECRCIPFEKVSNELRCVCVCVCNVVPYIWLRLFNLCIMSVPAPSCTFAYCMREPVWWPKPKRLRAYFGRTYIQLCECWHVR